MAAVEGAWQGADGPQGAPEQQDPNDEHNSPLFVSDAFRIWCMKVIPCTKRFVHDWTICPFAHAGEKAVRRDPRLHNYTGIACPDMKKTGSCIRGEKCPYAHNVFEYWLHPTRYRTQLCNDGPMCRRGICFFAHSLEELRVPACKPYVSPEALARASLEAIQQNPHPLGQQLTNPAVAAAQQQAAMAALGRPSGSRPRDVGASLAASAAPFVPGGYQPSGEPVRYSAPSAAGLLTTSGSAGELASGAFDFGGSLPLPHASPQRWTAPLQGHVGAGGYHAAAMAGGYPPTVHGARFSAPTLPPSGAGRLSGKRGGGGSHGSFSVDGSTDAAAGSHSSGSRSQQQPSPAQQAQQAAAAAVAGYPSAPLRGSGPHSKAASRGFAAVQHPPPQGFGSSPATNGGSVPSVRSVGAPGSVPSVRTSDSPSEEDAALSAGASGRDSPAEHDLAQSLASLKIAMTQQQLAAAAGSNHEVVITTLHQILKDAVAQQGNPSAGTSFGAQNSLGAGDAAAVAAAAAAAAQQHQQAAALPREASGGAAGRLSGGAGWPAGGSPDASYSFGPAPASDAVRARLSGDSLAGVAAMQPGAAPPSDGSPEALACLQAAVVAAQGGYPGLATLAGAPRAAGSPRV